MHRAAPVQSLLAIAIVVSSASIARADRGAVSTIAFGIDGRFLGDTWGDVGMPPLGGPGSQYAQLTARYTLSIEDALPDAPAPEWQHVQLVPELFVGGTRHDGDLEGQLGAGLRLQYDGMMRRRRNACGCDSPPPPWLRGVRGGAYVAARGLVEGDVRDPGGELAFGFYGYTRGGTRVGFENAFAFVHRPEADAESTHQLDIIFTTFISWR